MHTHTHVHASSLVHAAMVYLLLVRFCKHRAPTLHHIHTRIHYTQTYILTCARDNDVPFFGQVPQTPRASYMHQLHRIACGLCAPVYTCVYVCICIHISIHASTSQNCVRPMRTCVYVCMCVHMYTYINTCINFTELRAAYARLCIRVYVCMFVHLCTYIYTCINFTAYAHLCMCAHVHVCMCVRVIRPCDVCLEHACMRVSVCMLTYM
jgi:hypothetical protein